MFKFDRGDGPPRYSILNFQKLDDDSYVWKEIGNFSRELAFCGVLFCFILFSGFLEENKLIE